MSRAFVKEDTPDNTPLPDLPIPTGPNPVTRGGLTALRQRLADRQADLMHLRARPDRLDRLPEAAAERDIRYLEARLRSAIVIGPASLATGEVGFGSSVTVTDAAGASRIFRIVGEDEADAARHLITPHSPLGSALIGARVGDTVTWSKPARDEDLQITAIDTAPVP